jgi:hypothetical protein
VAVVVWCVVVEVVVLAVVEVVVVGADVVVVVVVCLCELCFLFGFGAAFCDSSGDVVVVLELVDVVLAAATFGVLLELELLEPQADRLSAAAVAISAANTARLNTTLRLTALRGRRSSCLGCAWR